MIAALTDFHTSSMKKHQSFYWMNHISPTSISQSCPDFTEKSEAIQSHFFLKNLFAKPHFQKFSFPFPTFFFFLPPQKQNELPKICLWFNSVLLSVSYSITLFLFFFLSHCGVLSCSIGFSLNPLRSLPNLPHPATFLSSVPLPKSYSLLCYLTTY